jgi:hypothetical protein
MLMRVGNVLDLDPVLASRRLNQRPALAGRLVHWPEREMLERVARLIAGLTAGKASSSAGGKIQACTRSTLFDIMISNRLTREDCHGPVHRSPSGRRR